MFDVDVSELIVIAVVALVVIGPERLPRVARMAGALLGRLQRYASDVKAEVNREMQLDEMNRLHQDMKDSVQSLETQVTHELNEVERVIDPNLDSIMAASDKTESLPQSEHKP